MSQVLELFLGVMTALGGFVDISELVFATSAGARFGYLLLWVVVVGTVGIGLISEMSGRMAAVLKMSTFTIVREHYGFNKEQGVLIASNIVNVLTCAAEVGGLAIVLQILLPVNYRLMLLVAAIVLLVTTYVLKFKWIERVYGLLGLTLHVYVVAARELQPDWHAALKGVWPHAPEPGMPDWMGYGYYVVGLFSSILMPYEIYFYSSGGNKDKKTEKNQVINK